MNIYRLTQKVNNGYDTFDSCIVIAKDEVEAKLIHPYLDYFWNENRWSQALNGKTYNEAYAVWANPNDVTVQLMGKATKGSKQGVMLASFNAG